MTITIAVDGVAALMAKLGAAGAKADAAVSQAVTATALMIQSDVKKRIQRGPKSGRVYFRRGANKGGSHRASAPGEAPATDTGVLVSSIYFKQEARFTATIGSRLAYAHYLEFGTARMKPRPAWQPAVMAHKGELARRVGAAIRGAMA